MNADDFADALGLYEPPPLDPPDLGSAKVVRHQPYNLAVWVVRGVMSTEDGDRLIQRLWDERHPRSGKKLTLWAGDTDAGLRMIFGHVVRGAWFADVKKVLDKHADPDHPWSYVQVVRWPLPEPAETG